MQDLKTLSQPPIFSTFSQINIESQKSTPKVTHPQNPKVSRIKRQYQLFSPACKKNQNSTYNRMLRLQNSSKEILSNKKEGQVRYFAKTPDYGDVKSKVILIQIDSFRDRPGSTHYKVNLQDKVRNELL
jgi:hypothetical protein